MGHHVIQIGKRRFACGLFWQSLSRPRELRQEAAELAAKINLDLMVLRSEHGIAQVGYGNRADGLRAGMLSLGAAVARSVALEGANFDGKQQRVASWIGAFRLPDDHWCYFAVRDESFLPNGDFAGTRDEVLERLKSDYALGGWNVVLGDTELQELGLHNFQVRTIAQCLPRTRRGDIRVLRDWRLQPVRRTLPWKSIGLGIVLLAAVATGTAWWMRHGTHRARPGPVSLPQPAKIPAPHPWPGQPLPAAMARACLDALGGVVAGGWQLESHRCTANASTDTWVRGSSTVDSLIGRLPQAEVALNGEKASSMVPLVLSGEGTDEALVPSRQVLAAVTSGLQKLGLAPTLALMPPPKAPPPVRIRMPGAPEVQLPDWRTYSLRVDSGGMAPTDVAAVFEQPGVRLERLTYNGQTWLIEGVIYAK